MLPAPLRTEASTMRSLLCLLPVLVLGVAHAQTADWRQDYRKVDVAEGIVSFIAEESPGGVVQGNVTLISGKRYSLVVDSGQYVGLAQRMIDDIRASGAPPVRYLVNTHWHGDHLLANFVFEQAYPELTVIQHAETARVGAKTYADWTSKRMPELKAYPAKLDKAVATGKTSKGVVLSEDQRESFRVDSALIKQWLATSSGTRWDAPDETITDAVTLDLGGRVVALRHLGKANTTGDLVVWDAATRTLVTGDVVVAPTPYSFGSYHSEWIETLAAMRALQPARIVPGHGEVMNDDSYLQRLSALLAETRAQVRKAVADGRTLEQMQKEITLPEFEKQFAGGDPARIRAFRGFYLEPGIAQAYKEAKGEPRSE
jgi:cyclase